MAFAMMSSDQEYGAPIGTVKGDMLYQDDQCAVYEVDENRQAPIHFRVVPKTVLHRWAKENAEHEKLLGHLLLVARNLAVSKGLYSKGYHVMVDENPRTGRLNSLHVFERALHHMLWPTGPGCRL